MIPADNASLPFLVFQMMAYLRGRGAPLKVSPHTGFGALAMLQGGCTHFMTMRHGGGEGGHVCPISRADTMPF